MRRQLKDYEKELLKDGNCYTMGALLREFYLDDVEREGFTFNKYVNSYKAFIEWNAETQTYTFFGKTHKAYFNTNADCIGVKEW